MSNPGRERRLPMSLQRCFQRNYEDICNEKIEFFVVCDFVPAADPSAACACPLGRENGAASSCGADRNRRGGLCRGIR